MREIFGAAAIVAAMGGAMLLLGAPHEEVVGRDFLRPLFRIGGAGLLGVVLIRVLFGPSAQADDAVRGRGPYDQRGTHVRAAAIIAQAIILAAAIHAAGTVL